MSGARQSERPEISVIIPHFENVDGLKHCLEALGRQKCGIPFEVIVVDNGSAAPPADLVAEAGARLAHEAEPGPGPARNRGASLACAPLLAFLDSDCIADADWVAAIARAFAQDETLDVIGGDIRIKLKDSSHGPDAIEAYESIFGYRQALYILRDGYAATCNMAVRRSAFQAVGPFGGIGTAEDMDWGARACARGHRMAYVPEMRIATRARGSFAELARKWDRHIAQHFEAVNGASSRLRWVLRALAMAVSPPAEMFRIWRSQQLKSNVARWGAATILTRIRLYRAWRMLALALGSKNIKAGGAWRGARRC